MNEIGSYEAKTHLPALLERVERGERFVITRHGRPVAELGPVARRDPQTIHAAVTAIDRLRNRLAKRGVTLRDALGNPERIRDGLHEGHHY
ncbi:MAG TPA: type II toxin-antitoxin system prevent-host-death family antitoxin [Casimicrobiaceae bacterium]|jgi:prevent-host-death family protein|nr:type II toxin-antitoxin system prevent-host-death family antitoxin [Casimicrobiaceae bacterium]